MSNKVGWFFIGLAAVSGVCLFVAWILDWNERADESIAQVDAMFADSDRIARDILGPKIVDDEHLIVLECRGEGFSRIPADGDVLSNDYDLDSFTRTWTYTGSETWIDFGQERTLIAFDRRARDNPEAKLACIDSQLVPIDSILDGSYSESKRTSYASSGTGFARGTRGGVLATREALERRCPATPGTGLSPLRAFGVWAGAWDTWPIEGAKCSEYSGLGREWERRPDFDLGTRSVAPLLDHKRLGGEGTPRSFQDANPCRIARPHPSGVSTQPLPSIPPGYAVSPELRAIPFSSRGFRLGMKSVPAASRGRDVPGATPGSPYVVRETSPPLRSTPHSTFRRRSLPAEVIPAGRLRGVERTRGPRRTQTDFATLGSGLRPSRQSRRSPVAVHRVPHLPRLPGERVASSDLPRPPQSCSDEGG